MTRISSAAHPQMARPLLGVAAAAYGVWQGTALVRRHKAEQRSHTLNPQRRLFFIGSTDDMIAEKLQTGDILFFNRDPLTMRPINALLCVCRKHFGGTDFDHCGVIVKSGNELMPRVVEASRFGVTVTPYDERVLRSTATEIWAQPLHFDRTPEKSEQATIFLKEREGGNGKMVSSGELTASIREAVSRDGVHPSASLVAAMLQSLGVLGVKESGGSSSEPLMGMRDLVALVEASSPSSPSSNSQWQFLRASAEAQIPIRHR